MAMDEREQLTDSAGEAEAGEPEESQGEAAEGAARMDAAKAFFRALHAGGDAPAADAGLGASAPETSSGPCLNCQHLDKQLTEAEQRAGEAEGLYRRMAADFENYRKRVDREREEFQAAGVQKAVESLLPALDDMDRAQSSLNPETPADKLIESLSLVFNRINRCLEQMGVKSFACVGEHFDPKFHEPVQEVETTEFPDGSVIHELRRGYKLNDRVIRPALVNVAANAGSPAAEAAPQEEAGESEVKPGDSDESGQKVYDLSEFEDAEDNAENQGDLSNEPAETP